MNTAKLLTILCASMMLAAPIASADAPKIRVKCEKRADRSRISIDAKNLIPGQQYSATVTSGQNVAPAPGENPFAQIAIGDEVQFDFDSAPNNIAAGAFPITANFIQGLVYAKVIEDGFTVVADTVACEIKN